MFRASRLCYLPRMRSIPALLALIPIFLLIAVGCRSAPKSAPAPTERLEAATLVATDWTCAEIRGAAVDPKRKAPTMRFNDDGRVAGATPVNRYNAPYRFSERARGIGLRFGLLVSTRMAADEESMRLESSFTRALESVDAATTEGGRLKLWSGESCVLVFDRAAE